MKHVEVDNHKLMFHPERVAEWKKKDDCVPIYIEVGLTNACNHRCIFCALDYLGKKRDFMNSDVLKSALRSMGEIGVKSVMFAGEGEPLMHKDIGDFVQTAKASGLDVSITTNGVLFDKEKREQCLPYLSWIRFSIDSGSPKNYAEVHVTKQSDFSRVIENIEEAVKLRNTKGLETTIGAQFLVIPQNTREVVKLARILRNVGVDNLQIKPYSHHPNSLNDLVVNLKRFNKLKKPLEKFNSERFEIKFRTATAERIEEGATYPRCYGTPFFALIDAKGNVIPCNLFYENEKFTFGNLYQQRFEEIWNGERRREVLERLYRRDISQCRRGCRLDADNRYLHRLKNPHPHDNFI
jgi:radical SAM protein with 4Fe4S-binding SPASM domain